MTVGGKGGGGGVTCGCSEGETDVGVFVVELEACTGRVSAAAAAHASRDAPTVFFFQQKADVVIQQPFHRLRVADCSAAWLLHLRLCCCIVRGGSGGGGCGGRGFFGGGRHALCSNLSAIYHAHVSFKLRTQTSHSNTTAAAPPPPPPPPRQLVMMTMAPPPEVFPIK